MDRALPAITRRTVGDNRISGRRDEASDAGSRDRTVSTCPHGDPATTAERHLIRTGDGQLSPHTSGEVDRFIGSHWGLMNRSTSRRPGIHSRHAQVLPTTTRNRVAPSNGESHAGASGVHRASQLVPHRPVGLCVPCLSVPRMNIKRQRVGGLTFVRVYLFGRNFVFSFCRTQKSHILIA